MYLVSLTTAEESNSEILNSYTKIQHRRAGSVVKWAVHSLSGMGRNINFGSTFINFLVQVQKRILHFHWKGAKDNNKAYRIHRHILTGKPLN